MFRQDENWAMRPAKTRAIRIPRRSPERTIDIAEARRWGGARSAARGMRTCIRLLVIIMYYMIFGCWILEVSQSSLRRGMIAPQKLLGNS